jgi:hypothetical protein
MRNDGFWQTLRIRWKRLPERQVAEFVKTITDVSEET